MVDLTTVESASGFEETAARLETEIGARGMTVFARIDHAAGAQAAGMELRPTLLVIFGNARAGTPLMQVDQRVGVDLPLRVLVWQDMAGTAWLSYEDPLRIVTRHGLGGSVGPIASRVSKAIEDVVRAAASA